MNPLRLLSELLIRIFSMLLLILIAVFSLSFFLFSMFLGLVMTLIAPSPTIRVQRMPTSPPSTPYSDENEQKTITVDYKIEDE